jgi:hypothetical protein
LVYLVALSLFISALISPSALAQGEGGLETSPGEFTVRDAPPMGEPWTIPQDIVVWNRDNIPRLVFLSVKIPSEENVRPGYEPLPNENWVQPYPTSAVIDENSYGLINISMDIPRWENLTGQKWEVWISAEREALPGEVALEAIVRVKIETTEELPPEETEGTNYFVFLAVGVGIAALAAGVWIWSRRRGRRPRKRTFSRSRR